MIREKLTGVGVAMITPFTSDGRVDYQALARMIDYVIEGGVDYIVALGTTAETPTLYMPERAVIAMFITNHIAGRVPLVMGCGGNSTSEVLDQLREFDLRGADAILSVTPYYNKPSQEGLYQHFKVVSEHSPLPIILYNIAGRTGVNMTAETTLRIAADFPNVIGIKEASGNIGQIQEIIDRRREGFLVLSGDDGIAVDVMRRGGDGVISVAVNAFPTDTEAELRLVEDKCRELGVRAVLSEVWAKGGEGGKALAEEVVRLCEQPSAEAFTFSYPTDTTLVNKLNAIVQRVYGGAQAVLTPAAQKQAERLTELGFGDLPVCMAKTQYSLSDDPALLGAPKDFAVTVRSLKVSAGAGFIVALTGEIMTMPGLPKVPAAEKIDVDENGRITGLF